VACPNCGSEGVDSEADCTRCRAAVCSDCGALLSDSANFCSQCGKRSSRASWPVESQAGSVSPPPHLSQHVLASRTAREGERKQVTVLFADLRGSLGVLAGVDPEDAQALLDVVVVAMVAAVHRYEGAVNQTMGDGIMALFGAPIAHEDHALRAACAALAMQEAVRALRDPSWEARGVQPQIRVGLHSGEVAIRTVRNDLSMEYRAVGQTTHIAARMEQLASPGRVWLTEDTFKLGQGLLRVTAIGPTLVRGVTAPIDVYELEGISVRTRFQANALRGLSALAGRDEILAQLETTLAAACAGRSQVAVLRGDPGVGKSRLCYELLQRAAPGTRVLEASSLSYLSTRPHGLLTSIVRALFGIDDADDRTQVVAKAQRCLTELGSDVERGLPVVFELLDVASRDRAWALLDPLQRRRRISELVRELLSSWCAHSTCVLLCEDLHWCDPDSLEFISSLVTRPPGSQLLLLLTHRSELTTPWRTSEHVVACDVLALDTDAADRLLATLLGPAESLAPLRRWLAVRTEGNPFFIEESARAVRDNGLVSERAGDPSDVPASIEALLNARVDRLPDAVLEVLQAAAVLGDQGPIEILRAIVELSPDEFNRRLELLRRAELLYEVKAVTVDAAHPQPSAATIRFKHALIQEVVYKRLVRPRRRALHARVVEVMERQYSTEGLPEHVERLAEHAYRAELWAQSAEYQKVACIRAASRGANALAIAHLERGLDALRHIATDPSHAPIAIDLRLTALAALMPLGGHEPVIELLREAADYARQLQDTGRLARISSQLSAELWVTARYDEARESAEQSLGLASQLGGDQFALEAAAHYNIAMVQHAQADFAGARKSLHELLSRFSGPAERRRFGWAGFPSVFIRTFIISTASMTGSFAEAARAFDEGRAIADELGHSFSRTMIMEQFAMCLLVQGEFERAAELLQQSVDICRQDEVHVMYAASAIHLGMALLELGSIDRARELIDSVDELALARAGHYATTYQLIARSELERRSGEFAQAELTAERAVQETARCGERGFHVRALIQLADVLADQAEHGARALAVYPDALERARALGMRPWAALAWQGMGRVHRARSADELAAGAFDCAHELWTELQAPKRLAQVASWRASNL
jgi:class 3 adenylate cyclase/tetratricopeptide (TPR) repeat protein